MTSSPEQRSRYLRVYSGIAVLSGIVIALAILSRCFGMLPTYEGLGDDSEAVRASVILAIRAISLVLAVFGGLHAAASWRVPEAEVERLTTRLQELADLAPSAEILLDVAHEHDSDLILPLMQWGTRSVLLLGLLGTVWGLSLAVLPVAEAVAETAPAAMHGAARGSNSEATVEKAPSASLDTVLARTGEAVGSLQTAFSTTLWGVVAAFTLLLLTALCGVAREVHITAVADMALSQGQVLQRAKQNREDVLTRAGRDFLAGAQVMHTAVGQFSAAATSIASHQVLYENALNGLQTTLAEIAQQIESAMTPSAERLKEAAGDVKDAAATLQQASTDNKTKVGDAAEKLERSAEALNDASLNVVKQQQSSLGAYRKELARASRELEAALAAIEAAVQQLPGAINSSTVPALEDWSKNQLREQEQAIKSLRQSLESLQQFLYWADQSTDQRDSRQKELHDKTVQTLQDLARYVRANQDGASVNQGHLHNIEQSALALQHTAAQAEARLESLTKLEQAVPSLRQQLEALVQLERDRAATTRQGWFARRGQDGLDREPVQRPGVDASDERPRDLDGAGR